MPPRLQSYERNRERRQRPLNGSRMGKTLPHSVEAEEHLLSCCLIDGADTLQRCVRGGLTASDFYVPAHALLFERMLGLLTVHEAVDVAMLAEDLKSAGKLQEVGDYVGLSRLEGKAGTTAQAPYFIDKVRDLARDRARARLASELFEATLAGDEARVAELEEQLQNLSRKRTAELPPILGFGEFVGATPRVKPPELIEGLLHKGAKLMLAGGSKSFKTWVLMDLALSVATGKPWWGFKTVQGRVLYLNMELMVEFAEERTRAIMEAKNIAPGDAGVLLDTWHLRGYARDFKELLPQILRAVAGVQYDLIILDPVYKVLGERDENANGEVAELLNEFEALAVRTKAALAYGHHHSKGSQGEKDARDRSSGAGAWTRDPDSLVDLTPHQEDEHFIVTYTLRNQKPRNKHVVKWEFPCMSTAPGLNPDDVRKPGRPKEHGVADILIALGGGMMGFAEWSRAAEDRGVKPSTFKRLLKEAVDGGKVKKVGQLYQLAGIAGGAK